MRRPLLYLDYETTPIVAWAWQFHDAELFHVMRDVQIMSVAWSWEGESEIYYMDLTEFKHKQGIFNVDDKELVKAFLPILDKAEAIIAHNGKGFDFKVFRGRLAIHGFPPHRNIKELDTKIWGRRFRFTNNRLDTIARQLGSSRKLATRKNLHYDCLEVNDPSAWRENKKYNKQDVAVLKEVAHKLAPFIISGIPNANDIYGTSMNCKNPLCGSASLKENGVRIVLGGHKVEYRCKDCGHYARGPLIRDTVVLVK